MVREAGGREGKGRVTVDCQCAEAQVGDQWEARGEWQAKASGEKW